MKSADMVGQKYGRLFVESFYKDSESGDYFGVCRCDCGQIKNIRLPSLANGHTKSCGCLQREIVAKTMSKHGKYKDKIYSVWVGMLQRCSNKSSNSYKNYGGRGIKVCDEWLSFDAFYEDMGDCPDGLSIDRIDNDGGYSKSNCRWATQREQKLNTRVRKDNLLGVRGVCKWGNRYKATAFGKYLGMFKTIEEAGIVAKKHREAAA